MIPCISSDYTWAATMHNTCQLGLTCCDTVEKEKKRILCPICLWLWLPCSSVCLFSSEHEGNSCSDEHFSYVLQTTSIQTHRSWPFTLSGQVGCVDESIGQETFCGNASFHKVFSCTQTKRLLGFCVRTDMPLRQVSTLYFCLPTKSQRKCSIYLKWRLNCRPL